MEFLPQREDSIVHDHQIGTETLKNIEWVADPKFTDSDVTRRDILDFGDEGFLLAHLFTSRECQYYIEEGHRHGFEAIHGARDDYRNSQRVLIKSPELADALWQRVAPFLEEVHIVGDPREQHIWGISSLLQGRWKPTGLNDVFRLCSYPPSGHFAPHFDGHFVLNSEVRSLKTLMLYLNDVTCGGTTNFVDETQTLYKDQDGRYCAEEKNILCRIEPEQGLAIIFNHHRLHEGEKLRAGVKYILRTDVMYNRIEKGKMNSPREEQALQCLQEAERLEAVGEHLKAAELYRRSFKLSPALEEELAK